MKCEDCSDDFQVNIKEVDEIKCPQCQGKNNKLISGREYFVKSMEVI